MSSYEDMAAWGRPSADTASSFVAVGWLGSNQKLVTGSVSSEFFGRFKELMAERFTSPALPVAPGVSSCAFCQFDAAMGTGVLFVPDGERMLVLPELAVHYVAAHHYRPPNEFVEAVPRCSPPRSRDHREQFLRAGGRDLVSLPASPGDVDDDEQPAAGA